MKGIGIHKILFCVLLSVLSLSVSYADDNGAYSSYAPYSMFGVGDLFSGASAYNMTMGGVGIASRNNRYVNALNPASLTARDSLSFMTDFSVYQNNKIFRQGSAASVSNLMNINDVIISFPVFNKTAMMLGIKPYSATGYDVNFYESNPGVLGTVGNVQHSYTGQGSIYQVFIGGAINLFNNLNLGAEYIYYTGNIQKQYSQSFLSDASAIGNTQSKESIITSNTAKFGIQYEQPFGKDVKVVLGATYKLSSKLNGFINNKISAGSIDISTSADTLSNMASPMRFADELGVGIAFVKGRKFRAEFDYIRSDWTNSGFAPEGVFKADVAHSFRVGFEYVPKPNDVRYYHNIIAYRAGAYFNKEYYTVGGQSVYARGITFGMTLPIFQWYNGVTIGVDLGQRGSLKNNLVRETYVNFSLGINLFDIWFQQYRYE